MQGVGPADVLLYFKCPTTEQMRCPVNAYLFFITRCIKPPVIARLLPGGSIDNFKFNHLNCRIHGLANESTLQANRSNRQDHCSEAVSCDLICSICFRTSSYSSSRAKRSIITGVLTEWAGSFFLVSPISLESSSSHFLSAAIVIIVSCSRYIAYR